jgi:hypothetical protein
VQVVVGDVTRHRRERAQGIDGVEVAQQENWLDGFASGKINLHAVGEILSAVYERSTADRLEASRKEGAHAVCRGLVIAGRFDFDKFAGGLHDLFLAGFEVAQPLAPNGTRLE